MLAKEFGWDDAFQFHISVGYNFAGIRSPKIDAFLNVMQDASRSEFWTKCLREAQECLPLFHNIDAPFISTIDPHVSNLVTLSTMHGCPANEIERIAAYLIEEKGFHTYIKCNPTLIGYKKVRNLLDELGDGYLTFNTSHFNHDMKLPEAIQMIVRLMKCAEQKGLLFGVKLTNTFPVVIQNRELVGDAMYMSGKPLFPLAIHVAKVLSDAINRKLPISFSGGIDPHNLEAVLLCGISPITVATLLLKTGGYKNLIRLASLVPIGIPAQVDCKKLGELCDSIASDRYYQKSKRKARTIVVSNPPAACLQCKNCVHVCPNRANFRIAEQKAAIHNREMIDIMRIF